MTINPSRAVGATSMGNSQLIAVTGNILSGQQEVLYVVDPNSKRIVVYRVNRASRGTLNLTDVRNFKYDLQLDYFKRQRPYVKEIRKKVK